MTQLLESYNAQKTRFLDDTSFCDANRALFRRFFEYEEYKLRRKNHLSELDAGCIKTLNAYMQRLRNVNKWFTNKPFADLTEADIRRVYDGLEDGTIMTRDGKRFKDRSSYYSKIFKSKIFAMVGKAETAKLVIEFSTPNELEVRYVLEEGVRRIFTYAFTREHRLLLWLAFDIGENVGSLLQLVKEDFTRQISTATSEPEYRVQLRRAILKRTRTARSELTLYRETVQLLDEHLDSLAPGALLFQLGYRAAVKFLRRAAASAQITCQPSGLRVTWKDLRSGMACDLLRKGWSRDEINARLGHKPSSKEIDKYINFFAMDCHQPKAKAHQFEISKLSEQLAQSQSREKLHAQRLHTVEEELTFMRARMREVMAVLQGAPNLKDVELAIATKIGPGIP